MRSSAARVLAGFLSSAAIWFAAVRGQDPAPPTEVKLSVDVGDLVRQIDAAMVKGQDIPVDQVVGIDERVEALFDKTGFLSATRPATFTSQMTFAGPAAAVLDAREKLRLKIPYRDTAGPGDIAGIGLGTVGGDYAAIVVTSHNYTTDNVHPIKGFSNNVLGIYLPPGVALEVTQGAGPGRILRATAAEGVVVAGNLTVGGRIAGDRDLVALRWTIPGSALRAGTGNVAGAEILPFRGRALSVTAVWVGPPLPPGEFSTLDLDVNADGKSLWGGMPAHRPILSAARPAAMFSTSPFPVPVYPEVRAGAVLMVDVDSVPAAWGAGGGPAGGEVRITGWFLVEQP